MYCKIHLAVLLLSLLLVIAQCRQVPRFHELDDEDKELFRAAYDTPSYDSDQYEEDDDLKLGHVDLVKDGLWALKAKLKELKAFDKALAANLLATKLKVKDLLVNHLDVIKKHNHHKPSYDYSYESSSYQQPSYAQPQYSAPAPQYGAPAPQYGAPAPQYGAPAPQYGAHAPQYGAPAPQYGHDPYYGH